MLPLLLLAALVDTSRTLPNGQLGLAFKEAKRSEDIALRLQQSRNAQQLLKSQHPQQHQHYGLGLSHPQTHSLRYHPGQLQQHQHLQHPDHLQQQYDLDESEAGDSAAATASTVPKRTRRRRRPRKSKSSSSVTSGNPATETTHTGAGFVDHVNAPTATSAALSLQKGVATSKKQHDAPMTKRDLYFCLRCGCVIVGKQGMDSAVGRVTLVNWDYEVVFDKFVKVPLVVADYRTEITGITKHDLISPNAVSFDRVRSEVAKLIKGKILIGHGLEVDLSALGLAHPWSDVRDTATYAPYMEEITDSMSTMLLPRDLTDLVQNQLARDVTGCPIAEGRACLDLYKAVRNKWEQDLQNLVQQKEKQRQLVMNMRAGRRGSNITSRMSVPLSAIREDETARHGAALGVPAHGTFLSPTFPTNGPSIYDQTSMISSTQPSTFYAASISEDDMSSHTSGSFISQDTDLASTISSVSRLEYSASEIENLRETMVKSSIQGTGFSVITNAFRSHRNEAFVYRGSTGSTGGSQPLIRSHGTMSNADFASSTDSSGIWSHSPPGTVISNNSTGSNEHQQDPSQLQEAQCWPNLAMAGGTTMQYPAYGNEMSTELVNEEELLQHLPSELIAGLDGDTDETPLPSLPRLNRPTSRSRDSGVLQQTHSVSSGSNNNNSTSSSNHQVKEWTGWQTTTERPSPGNSGWFRSLRK